MDFDSMIEEIKKDYVSPQSLGLRTTKKVIKGEVEEYVKSCRYNVHLILTNHHKFESLVWDNFSSSVYFEGQKLTNHLITELCIWFEKVYQITIQEADFRKVLHLVANQNPVHLLEEFLDSFNEAYPEKNGWDGVPRLETLLIKYFGVQDTKLTRAYSKKFFIGAIRRALYSTLEKPVKKDESLILYGTQGIGKTMAVKALALQERWFSNEELDIKSKDSYYKIHGKLLYEVGEWAGRTKDHNQQKNWQTKTIDRFRPVSATYQVEIPRKVSFIITTNEMNLFTDPSGSRRYWPVRCGYDYTRNKAGEIVGVAWAPHKKINVVELEKIAPQLWLEARFLANETNEDGTQKHIHYLSPTEEEARKESNKLYNSSHPWEEAVLREIDSLGGRATVNMIMNNMGLPYYEQNRKSKTIIESILQQNEYKKCRFRIDRSHVRGWKK
ncbi:MAG: hypothetical protein CMC15_15325 [Flavobacteriaceae bacterium]|nr:hypothetical protein [Flavobacteriaceae bacterium]